MNWSPRFAHDTTALPWLHVQNVVETWYPNKNDHGVKRPIEYERKHYGDVIMGKIASQITSLTIVYSTVYSGADQRKHQSSASLAFVRGIHRGPVNSPHKWPVTRKMFSFGDVIMCTQNTFHLTDFINQSYTELSHNCGEKKRKQKQHTKIQKQLRSKWSKWMIKWMLSGFLAFYWSFVDFTHKKTNDADFSSVIYIYIYTREIFLNKFLNFGDFTQITSLQCIVY